MYEVEAKVRVADPGPLRQALLASGAEHEGPTVEEDTFFVHGGRDLPAADEVLRLRRAGGTLELTWKGKRQEAEAKVREEHSVGLLGDPSLLLSALGFKPSCHLRKARERFRSREGEVTLDHLEGLGWFAEVELMGDSPQPLVERVQAHLETLGLAGAETVKESYLELALAAGARAVTRS